MTIYTSDGKKIIGCYDFLLPKTWEETLAKYIGTENRYEIKSFINNQMLAILHETEAEHPKEVKRIISICYNVCSAADFNYRIRMEDE